MKTLGLLFPNSLVGREVRERLAERSDLCRELRLLTVDDEEVGAIAEFRGAAMVQRLEQGSLDGVDVLVVAGWSPEVPAIVSTRPAGCRAVLMSPADDQGGLHVVDSINLDDAAGAELAVSPHPAAVHLALVAAPLVPAGLEELSATVLQPVSMLASGALEELLEQTRDLLSFRNVQATLSLPSQAAFNLFPTAPEPDLLQPTFRQLWPHTPSLRARIVQAGVFHCLSASIELRFATPVAPDAIREALESHPHVTCWEDEDEPLSPVRGASFDDVLVSQLSPCPGRPEVLWAWTVMDNLTRGGAINALAIAEQMGKVN